MLGSDSTETARGGRSAWPGWGFAAMVLLLVFPSSGFVQKYAGLAGVAGYLALVTIVLFLPWRFGGRFAPWVRRNFRWLSVLTLSGLAICFSIAYPIENSKGVGKSSDRDDGLDLAVSRMADGRSPYYPSHERIGPLSVLPGAIVLAAPFVVLGTSGYQNIFWLAVFLFVACWTFRDRAVAIVLLTVPLALSHAALYEFVSGGDMLANGIYVAVFFLLALKSWMNPQGAGWTRWTASVLLGVGLASRPNFLLLMPIFGAVLWRAVGLRQAAMAAGLAVLVSAAITVPFYLHDPAGFTPLLARDKLALSGNVMPWAGKVMIGMTALLGVAGAWVMLRSAVEDLQRAFFRWCALVTLCPMVCAVVLATSISGHLDFGFMRDRYGLMYVFFALYGWGGQWLHGFQSSRMAGTH